MTEYLRVKDWAEHQHYKNKDGPPKWIKLHRRVLTDYGIRQLSESDRFKLIAVWLLAAETDGMIPDDPKYVAKCIDVKRIDLDLFVNKGFLERVYSDSRVALEVVYPQQNRTEEEEIRADQTVDREHAIERLMLELRDKDSRTENVVRTIIASLGLSVGDIEAAREQAQGPGVTSPAAVAVSALKKRRQVA